MHVHYFALTFKNLEISSCKTACSKNDYITVNQSEGT